MYKRQAPYISALDYNVRLQRLFIFSEGSDYLEVGAGVGNSINFENVPSWTNDRRTFLAPIEKLEYGRSYPDEKVYSLKIQLKQRVGGRGAIGGLQSVYYLREEGS